MSLRAQNAIGSLVKKMSIISVFLFLIQTTSSFRVFSSIPSALLYECDDIQSAIRANMLNGSPVLFFWRHSSCTGPRIRTLGWSKRGTAELGDLEFLSLGKLGGRIPRAFSLFLFFFSCDLKSEGDQLQSVEYMGVAMEWKNGRTLCSSIYQSVDRSL